MLVFEATIALCVLGSVAPATINVNSLYNEYCDICEDHTLCKFQGLGESCESPTEGGITLDEKIYILHRHNWYRKILAKGLETRGVNGTSQPKAANMMKMVWDDELQKIAQHWADQCQFQHDECRHDRRWKVGQNIYWHWRLPVTKHINWTAAMSSWFDEVEHFDPEIISSYEFNPETGHYSQLAWHDSIFIGCGRRSYGPNKLYVCNYGPTGNWLTEPLYQIGEPCSQCPEGTFCEDGLCSTQTDQNGTTPTTGSTGDTTVSDSLTPPAIGAISIYSTSEGESENDTQPLTTELPIHQNLIFDETDLDIPDDEGIRKDIEEIKEKIRLLVNRIALKKLKLQENN